MLLRLLREPSGLDCTFGVLFLDGYYECFTLENTQKIIPIGVYPVSLYASPRNKRNVPLLHDVPNRSEIEMHIANYPRELEGCIAVGTSFSVSSVFQSTDAFLKLMSKLKFDNLKIQIENSK